MNSLILALVDIRMNEQSETQEDDNAAVAKTLAPRWLSGGRKDVPLEDNPTAIAYTEFLRRLSSIFLREQKDRSTKRGK